MKPQERFQAQTAAEAERRRLFALLEALPALVYLKAPDYTLRFANRRFREDYGDPEEKRCYEIFGRTEPCRQCVSLQVLETGNPIKVEWTWTKGKQTYELSHYPFSDIDNSPLVLTLGIDITERKRLEEALRQSQARLEEAQHMVRVGSWDWDVVRNESFWSPEMFHLLGLPPQLQGLNYEEFSSYIHPDDREMAHRAVAGALSGAKPYGLDFRLQRLDGSEIYVHVEAETHFDDRGRPVKMLGTMQDVTDRRRMEEQLRESEAGLRHLASQLLMVQEQERARIARGLHDELGQSLMVMKMKMRAMQRQALAGNQPFKDDFSEMAASLNEVVENVRRIARDLSPYLLADLGLEVALHRLFEEFSRHCRIDLELHGDLAGINDAFPAGDQIHIYRIFQECLTNIGKHAGASTLRVAVTRQDREVFFLLEDNGRGFDLEAVQESAASSKGIGLATLEERARLLGGKMSISSVPGKGTRTSLVFPVKSANQPRGHEDLTY